MHSNIFSYKGVEQNTFVVTGNSTVPVIGVDYVKLTATCTDPQGNTDATFGGLVTFSDAISGNILGTAPASNGVATLTVGPIMSTATVNAEVTGTHA